ncbi:secretogranin-3 isoform X2 [Thalassophryne amazonica]|uniref:secretogranin-3 isoform X2 n=1 Tax=Thalassophryne amazonica TaxID=390379 RepID=UPI001471884C|nr:secretogranin-3 isoform X2 [Thalassophryne amazonica]
MASVSVRLCALLLLLTLTVVSHITAFPTTTASVDAVYNRQLTEERPLQEQIAEADSVKAAVQSAERKSPTASKDKDSDQSHDEFTAHKSTAESQESKDTAEVSQKKEQYIQDESDSTKSRRLAEDYDSTKNGMEYDDPESFRQVDGTPLTAGDIVQKIANKIYEEDDRGVFDRTVSKLLKLGLITDSQADTLEYQVAEALQDLITKNAKNNEIEDIDDNDQETEEEQEDQMSDPNTDTWPSARRHYSDDDEDEDEDEEEVEENETEDEVERDAEDEGDDTLDRDTEEGNEVRTEDGLQDLQYFPNFYRLLRSLDSDRDTQERETLITIMKTLIDFVKMMVKYGTITPEEGVSYLENLDAMIAMQTKNKLGKSLMLPDFTGPAGKNLDEDDNTKAEAAKMQKEYENLKDSTKEEQPQTETNVPGKSETYLDAIRKNIEWLKKHNEEEGKEDYDLSKLKDFMDQQVDSYIEKGIITKDEGDTIKRIYSSL